MTNNLSNPSSHAGHRDRLRSRFLEAPQALSEAELLELLLVYAIPRRDVAPIARGLLERYTDLSHVLSAPLDELQAFPGLGESSAALLRLVDTLVKPMVSDASQPTLFPLPAAVIETGSAESAGAGEPRERSMRVFTNDEIANSLAFLPRAVEFTRLEDYQHFLQAQLPYNSQETRRRRANYFLDRFFPAGRLDTPLRTFLTKSKDPNSLKAAIFYHVLQSEPIAVKVADELVYPALPTGFVNRQELREFVLKYLPQAGESSQANMLRSIFYTYSLLDVGTVRDDSLRFRLRPGSLEAFAYLFTSEFPEPGIYSYEMLYQGPLHRWLLWDKEWIRKQLYNLRDLGLLAKVSEIDTVHQFTVALDQRAALEQFFSVVQDKRPALRDDDRNTYAEGEGGS